MKLVEEYKYSGGFWLSVFSALLAWEARTSYLLTSNSVSPLARIILLLPPVSFGDLQPVTLSAAKSLARRTKRSFAALRMTARTPLQSAHGKPSLHMS